MTGREFYLIDNFVDVTLKEDHLWRQLEICYFDPLVSDMDDKWVDEFVELVSTSSNCYALLTHNLRGRQ